MLEYFHTLKTKIETADNTDYEVANRMIKRKAVLNKRRLEEITKHYNVILSANIKKRGDINKLRKERTLYDHIFKTLEYQILGQEGKLFKIIKKNKEKEELVKKSQEQLNSIKELAGKNGNNELFKLIEAEKNKYNANLDKLKEEVDDNKEVYKNMHNQRKTMNVQKMSWFRRGNRPKIIDQKLVDVCEKIEFFESLLPVFKFHTENQDENMIIDHLANGEETNQKLFEEFCELENELEDIKTTLADNISRMEKEDNMSVSTKATVKVVKQESYCSEEEVNNQLNDSNKELEQILVS